MSSGAGSLFIISAPSGAGKTTLVRALLERDPALKLSVSYTTRAPRPGEQDGRDYHFVTVEQFHVRREAGEFLEWAEVHGNFYATSRVWIEEEMRAGRDIVLEIDWQGARQVGAAFPDAVGIFILPPSMQELEKRLIGRGQDAPEVIARRIANARDEMAHAPEFDYVIINKELRIAIEQASSLIDAARLRYGVQRAREPELFSHLIRTTEKD